MKNEICIGMAGAGRATELHINALKRFTGIPLRFKMIVVTQRAAGSCKSYIWI